MIDELFGTAVNPRHECGWLAKGWPWRRRYAVYCNTCGVTSVYIARRGIVQAAAQIHSVEPTWDPRPGVEAWKET